jgi:formylglycine-generating enzyme required for sulfatase activity
MNAAAVAAGIVALIAAASSPVAADGAPAPSSPGAVFRDCPDACPEMVVIPPGRYDMGSPPTEPGRFDSESPQHRVTIGYPLAVGRYDVTRGEYAAFVAATGYKPAGGCFTLDLSGAAVGENARANWRRPGFRQTARDPVVCVNVDDAGAYVAWLSRKTGHAYRLLSEAEYEYAERAGTATAFWWGNDATAICHFANAADLDAKARFPTAQSMFPGSAVDSCHDGYAFTSPVGRYAPNAFGLYDMAGDVWSWLTDCENHSYAGAPTDGSASLAGDCGRRALRGGSWQYDARILRSANRDVAPASARLIEVGFRVARAL